MIHPEDLKYFVEVAHSKNISTAAIKLGKTQPAISTAIKRIEAELGAKVIHRLKYGIELTEAGKSLFTESHQIFLNWNSLKNRVFRQELELNGHVTIGCHPTVGMYSLNKFIPELMSKHKKLNIDFDFCSSSDVLNKILEFKIDIGLIINPIFHSDLFVQKICDDKVSFYRSKSIHNPQNDIHSGETILICNKDINSLSELLQKYKKRRIVFQRIIHSSNFENTAALVAAGAGVGFLPSRIEIQNIETGIELIEQAPTHIDHLFLVYRTENRKSFLIQGVANLMKTTLKSKL